MPNETHLRSLIKTFSWRLFGSAVTFITVWVFSSSFSLASTVTMVREILVSILYYIHERVWNKIRWGISHYAENRKL